MDAEGLELSREQRERGYLEKLASGDERALWVCAADKLHNTRAIPSDLARSTDPEAFWSRFSVSEAQSIGWYRRVHDKLAELGFDTPILDELRAAVEELEGHLPHG